MKLTQDEAANPDKKPPEINSIGSIDIKLAADQNEPQIVLATEMESYVSPPNSSITEAMLQAMYYSVLSRS